MAKVIAAKVVQTKYGSYSIHYHTPEGRRRRLTVGSDEQVANRIAMKFIDWLLDGKDPEREMNCAQQREQARDISMREFFPTFIEKHGSRQSESMQTLYHYMFRNVCRCPELADIPLCDIKPRLMADYMDSRMRVDGVQAATVNREATFVRCLLGVAERRELIDRNPLHGFKLLKESPKREVNITPEQISQLIDALPESLGNIVEFAVYTGFRKDNVLSLKINQVRIHDISPQGTGGEVDLLVKGGRWETKPLKPEAAEVLKRAIGKREEGYVFIGPSPVPDTVVASRRSTGPYRG